MCVRKCVCASVRDNINPSKQKQEATKQIDGGQLSFEQTGPQDGGKRDIKEVYLKRLERSCYCTADLL